MTEPVDTAAVRDALTELRALLFNGNHDQLPGALGPYIRVDPFLYSLREEMNWGNSQIRRCRALIEAVIQLSFADVPALAVPVYDALLEMFGGAA